MVSVVSGHRSHIGNPNILGCSIPINGLMSIPQDRYAIDSCSASERSWATTSPTQWYTPGFPSLSRLEEMLGSMTPSFD